MRYSIYVLLSFTFLAGSLSAFSPFNSAPYLTPTETPSNSALVSWNTELAESTIIAYGLTIVLEDTLRLDGVRNHHHIMLTCLLPETRYYYQVLTDGELYHFWTFPEQSDTCSFVAFGDTRSDSAAHQSVIDRMATCEFDFVMHSGDLVNDGDRTVDWRIFFNVEDTVLSYHHFLPAIGNHESPYWPYDTLFPLPDSEKYYSVTYGNAHCIMLNTSMDLYGAQRDWLIADLIESSSDTTIDWIFVNLHKPPYSSGNHGSSLDVRNAWCPLFEQYGVDIVFAGHDHNYERTDSVNGVIYIVTGGGGAPLRDVGTSSWTIYSEKTFHFCDIEIMKRTLKLTAIRPDGTVLDQFSINKIIGVEEVVQYGEESMVAAPNPFTNKLMIHYTLERQQHVLARVYDRAGRFVHTVINGVQEPGAHAAVWYGEDAEGHSVDTGVYYLIFIVDGPIISKKVVRIAK